MPAEHVLLALTAILLLGLGAQWLAWRLRLPSILLLLLFGFAAGNLFPEYGTDRVFGDLLLPIVSVSVSIILFEGGLTLSFRDLPEVGTTVLRLISLGVLVTGAVATLAAWLLVGLDLETALLVGTLLTVTGPTVVGPLLRHIRPAGTAGSILNWEGILVDPVGALLAVLVFQAVLAGRLGDAVGWMIWSVFEALLIGLVIGLAVALFMVQALRRHWVPDHLQNPFALTMVVTSSLLSNHLHHESGLLTATIMGLILANQRRFPVRHIVEFKENLRTLLISTLFILLAARVRLDDMRALTLGSAGFVLILILVARPLAVIVSTWASEVPLRQRVLLAWMAPRGIVAAAVASVFALEDRLVQGDRIVPLVFLVIVGTVTVYGLTAGPLARRLGLAEKDPQGFLIVGADPFGRAVATALKDHGLAVLVVDTNFRKIAAARMAGIPSWHGSILAEYAIQEMRLAGIGRLLAMTANDEANTLAAIRLTELFSRADVFQLPSESRGEGHRETGVPHDLSARLLFGEGCTHRVLNDRVRAGWNVKTTPLTEKFDSAAFRELHGEDSVILFTSNGAGRVVPVTLDAPAATEPGQTLIALVRTPANHNSLRA